MGMTWLGYRLAQPEAREILGDMERLEELLESEEDAASVDLDKTWHGLHWLLSGSADATTSVVSAAILGGEPIGEDIGYGPGRLLTAAEVADVSRVLGDLDVDTLAMRMDPAAMRKASIYPDIWDEDGIFADYLAPAYRDLRDFYRDAAEAGEAVIQILC